METLPIPWAGALDAGSPQPCIASFRRSRRKRVPITQLTPATPTGYQSPAYTFPVAATIAVARRGNNPPKTPFPMWYGKESEVYRTLGGNNSTRNAAIGPYTIVA